MVDQIECQHNQYEEALNESVEELQDMASLFNLTIVHVVNFGSQILKEVTIEEVKQLLNK